MPTPPADSANEPAESHSIRCPYCDHKFAISLCTEQDTLLPVANAELHVLPYARDVDIFDPPVDQANSRWGQVGEDFLGGIQYDRLFGILRISRALKVYYCVARCRKCGVRTGEQTKVNRKRGLLDVFANLTSQTKPLAAVWPQLFSTDPDDGLRLFSPRDFLSRLFGSYHTVAVFLLLLYVGSFIPDVVTTLRQVPPSLGAFLTEQFPALFLRGIMVLSLFFLIAVRMRLIRSFTDEAALAKLFKLQHKRGLVYWMNWAVSRFTGYQRQGKPVTANSVLFFGGFISSCILLVAWGLSYAALPLSAPPVPVYAAVAELVFWLIVSFLFGVIVWNQFEIPHYILPSLERIPMQAEPTASFTRNFGIIIWIGIYAACGILLLCTTFIAVTILPVVVPGFPEPQWIVVWAQFALVVFYSILIIRFVQKHMLKKVLLIVLLVLAYFSLKFWVPSLGMTGAAEIGRNTEMLLTFCLAAYFFFKLYGITCNSIRRTYVGEIVQEAERRRREASAGPGSGRIQQADGQGENPQGERHDPHHPVRTGQTNRTNVGDYYVFPAGDNVFDGLLGLLREASIDSTGHGLAEAFEQKSTVSNQSGRNCVGFCLSVCLNYCVNPLFQGACSGKSRLAYLYHARMENEEPFITNRRRYQPVMLRQLFSDEEMPGTGRFQKTTKRRSESGGKTTAFLFPSSYLSSPRPPPDGYAATAWTRA